MSAPYVVGNALTPNGVAAGTTISFNKPSGVVDGDVLLVVLRAQGTVTGRTPITLPSGWTRIGSVNGNADRAQGIFYKAIPSASAEAATSYTFGPGFTSGRIVGGIGIVRGVDLTNIEGGAAPYTNTDLAAFTTSKVPALVVAVWGDERTSPRSHIPSATPANYTPVFNAQNTLDSSTTGSRTAAWAGTYSIPSTGSTAVPLASLTWPDGVSANKAVNATFNGLADAKPGVAIKDASGVSYHATYLDSGLVRKAARSLRKWLPGYASVDALWSALLAGKAPTSAHRGGSSNFPQYTQYGYDRSVMRGFPVLEFSCAWPSDTDNVFGGDSLYLDPTALNNSSGTSLVIANLTWATIFSNYQNVVGANNAPQPYFRLIEFLDKYTPNHVVMVDPKFGVQTQTLINKLLDICDAHGGPNKIIIKFDAAGGTPLATSAKARGYKTMNYWGTDLATLTSQQSNWDLLGFSYSASQSDWDTVKSFGKPTWAAIIPDQAGADSARAKGASLLMCRDVLNIKSRGPLNT